MLARIRPRLTYANVVATLALIVAVGGASAFAATQLPKNSVGAKQIKKNAVTSSKVKDHSLLGVDFQAGQLPPGPQGLPGPTGPQGPQGPAGAAPACEGNTAGDIMVSAGAVCIDRYEASVWSSPTGGTQYGVNADDYPCSDTGQNCDNIYARSVPGVTPSSNLTYFQAQQALANVGKRLPTNAEWQQAVAGTPDSSACNVSSEITAKTGEYAGCISRWGANDMVGNLFEWVADWVPASTEDCPGWEAGFSNDEMCLSGAQPTRKDPGDILRGGGSGYPVGAGPFSILAYGEPNNPGSNKGFRGVR